VKIRQLHKWNLSYAQARELQSRLAREVRFTPVKAPPRLVAGLDCAFSRDGRRIVAVVVVLKLPGFELVETKKAVRKVAMPYIPGLLSFREAPACLAAVRKLRLEPDLFIIDGQGIAHPRRLGLAAHLGLFFDKPTIGCAKSKLTGRYEEPARVKSSHCELVDNGEVIGAVLRTRTDVKCVFVSVGHKCRLTDAIKMTLACTTKYRLPEPTRLAHQLVTKAKASLL